MKRIQRTVLFCAAALLGAVDALAQESLDVLTWNIWHEGREDGDDIGPERVIQILRESGADLIAMQETYGSGERISKALEFNFHPRGTNVSILSRYPVLEDLSVHEEFNCVGSLIDVPDSKAVAFFSIWLPYSGEIWEVGTRDLSKPDEIRAACQASHETLLELWKNIQERLAPEKYEGLPIVIAGDFNSMSALDYSEVNLDQYGVVIDWPTSHILPRAGFVDTYRALHPSFDRALDATWTPRFPSQEQDRIDFVFLRAKAWQPSSSRVLNTHPEGFPSDHGAVLTTLQCVEPAGLHDVPLRAVTYNIRRALGTDNRVDLERSAKVLRDLAPDFVGLQEIDLGTERSHGLNQANELGRRLDLHPVFGSFMDYQGGRYGMAILSKHPIVRTQILQLPEGNEPRIALLAETRLRSGETIWLVDVHLDWVDDDTFRFQQAERLAEHLRTLQSPYVLLGDFNDTPGSRTLSLFEGIAAPAKKPKAARFTFPAQDPTTEIDFVFTAPRDVWRANEVRVVNEPLASDHRPVVVDLTLRPSR